ncbi:DUF1758 domain-containing protein [Nephila pilipes]|uniref:DUF1758 domain-containing protein n=1 Tax=Nephila pilipes TaxID=299642 RepID=A0A8X6TVT4_NEPPI|nr:DUF1758 domain-containing protein [Nephila pilipes]
MSNGGRLSDFVVSGSRLLLGFDKRVPTVEFFIGSCRWSLQDRCDELTDSTLVNFVLSERESVSTEMRSFWELESSGIRGDEIDSDMEDKEGFREINKSVQVEENRYCVKLPWKEGMQEKLGNNREVALRRF